jgi:4-hydroxy-tetrahydrodipicolinate reductase
MKIGLIGYGRMGKEVERVAQERGHSIALKFTSKSPLLSKEEAQHIDVGIHFARAETVLRDVGHWCGLGKNLVIGTTGWGKDLDAVSALVKKADAGVVYASNFSVGVNLMFRLAKELGALVNALPDYDLSVHEAHHKEKVDSPSGTALTLADILLERIKRKTGKHTGPLQGKINPEFLQIVSTRLGSVVGTHTVLVDSSADSIELTHTAKNRSGFALGAVLAAEWIHGKKGLLTMDDLFEDLFRGESI